MAITKVSRDLLNTSIVDNGNATAITIDSSENVGIGTDESCFKCLKFLTQTNAVGPVFTLTNESLAVTAADVVLGKLNFSSNDPSGSGGTGIGGSIGVFSERAFDGGPANTYMALSTRTSATNTERLRIDSSGNVVIYSDSAAASGTKSLQFFRDSVERGRVKFDFSNSSLNLQADGVMTFMTAGENERMRIDSSGNVLVGKTGSAVGSAGAELQSGAGANAAIIGTASVQPLILNRLSTDGIIADFRKDSTSVGSIGSRSSGANLYIALRTETAGDGCGLTGSDSSTGAILPSDGNGATADNHIDLGAPAVRFKDLYLSGGAYLGGTGAANLLDDYEEGTWTPVTNSGSWTVNSATYTKVGNMVTCRFKVTATATIEASDLYGLPFTPASEAAGVCGYQNSEASVVFSIAVQTSSVWNLRVGSTQKGLTNGALIYGIFTYHTTA
jgi:hypothetical protein